MEHHTLLQSENLYFLLFHGSTFNNNFFFKLPSLLPPGNRLLPYDVIRLTCQQVQQPQWNSLPEWDFPLYWMHPQLSSRSRWWQNLMPGEKRKWELKPWSSIIWECFKVCFCSFLHKIWTLIKTSYKFNVTYSFFEWWQNNNFVLFLFIQNAEATCI